MSITAAIEPTGEQQNALDQIGDWFNDRPLENVMAVGGLAGTGKTTIARLVPDWLQLNPHRVAFVAYTGKAGTRLPHGSTIHKLIYTPRERHCAECPRDRDPKHGTCHDTRCPDCKTTFFRRPNLEDYDLIVIDEASMVDYITCIDIASFRVPMLWIGDHGQLPPIGDNFSLMVQPTVRLETIHRQVADSPILKLALRVRNTGRIPLGEFRDKAAKRRTVPLSTLDEYDLILTGRNKTRIAINRAIRSMRGIDPDSPPQTGETVVCLRNSYDDGVFNGQRGVVVDCDPNWHPKQYAMRVLLEDDSIVEVAALKDQFHRERLLGAPRYFGLFDFGYALTVHKAQGSEAESVLVIEEPVGRTFDERRRWLCTAVTRAKSKLQIAEKIEEEVQFMLLNGTFTVDDIGVQRASACFTNWLNRHYPMQTWSVRLREQEWPAVEPYSLPREINEGVGRPDDVNPCG